MTKKTSNNAKAAQAHWRLMKKISSQLEGVSQGQVHRAWKHGVKDYVTKNKLKTTLTTAQVQELEKIILGKSIFEEKVEVKKLNPSRVAATFGQEKSYAIEVVYQGDPGSFINMLLALPRVKSINFERE